MSIAGKKYRYVKPYWKLAVFSLVMLIAMVGFDLAIPGLVEHIIDNGIRARDMSVVLKTAIVMLVISVLDAAVAVLKT